jgi:hypothetical protein
MPPHLPEHDAGVAGLSSLVTGLQAKANEEIRHSILMLDLAAHHARQIVQHLNDSATKENFNAHIATIEQLIDLARNMSSKL